MHVFEHIFIDISTCMYVRDTNNNLSKLIETDKKNEILQEKMNLLKRRIKNETFVNQYFG